LLSSRGISTPSLQARGEQRRFFYFNNDRDIPGADHPINNVMTWGDHSLPAPLQPLTKQSRWYVWKWVPKEGDPTKLGKPPLQAAYGMRLAANNNPDDWCNYERAKSYVDGGQAHGAGFALTGFNVWAFDLDHCFDANGDLYPNARKLVERCGSYCEWTPSGDGLRILGVADLATSQKRQRVITMPEGWNLEVYEAGCTRFITVSGRPFENYCVDVRDLGDIVAEYLKGHEAQRPTQQAEGLDDQPLDWARFCAAVRAIPNDGTAQEVANWDGGVDRDSIWVPLGACIYRTGNKDAWPLFLEFSQKSKKFKPRETKRVWKSFEKNPNPTSGKPWKVGSV
jgi:hypothetical protein